MTFGQGHEWNERINKMQLWNTNIAPPPINKVKNGIDLDPLSIEQ